MKPIRVMPLLFLAVLLVGCGPTAKCPPRPEASAQVAPAAPLPFRIGRVTYLPAPADEQVEDKMIFEPQYLSDLMTITKEALYAPEFNNAQSDAAVNVEIKAKGMLLGANSAWDPSPSLFAAQYTVTDVATGRVLLQKDYENEQDFVFERTRCSDPGNSVRAFQSAVNLVTGQFMHDLAGLTPTPITNDPQARIHGSLQSVSSSVPLTKDNIRWIFHHAGERYGKASYSLNFIARLMSVLPARVSRDIAAGHLFDQDPATIYTLEIVVPQIAASRGGLFSKQRNRFAADAVIRKNEEEIGSVELNLDDYDKFESFENVVALYSAKITKYLSKMNAEESK